MSEFVTYLKDELGLSVIDAEWSGTADLPIFLAKAAVYRRCSCSGVGFLSAQVDAQATLPELKRIAAQVSAKSGLQVVLVAQIDARQRSALVSQGIPFVVPGKQAFLPMLGFAARSRRPICSLAEVMAPGTQAVFVTMLANPDLRTSGALLEAAAMSRTGVSRALDDLSRRGLISKSKDGRQVVVTLGGNRNEMIRRAVDCLRNPVARTVHVRKGKQTDLLPLAGESALSERSMLTSPKIECRAMSRGEFAGFGFREVVPGELPDDKTVQLQLWTYDPLVARESRVDDVSLALSLAGEADERVIGQLNELFGEELWQ